MQKASSGRGSRRSFVNPRAVSTEAARAFTAEQGRAECRERLALDMNRGPAGRNVAWDLPRSRGVTRR